MRTPCFLLIAFSILFGSSASAQNNHPIHERLDRVPKVWEEGPVHRLTLEEYEATLEFWQERHGDRLVVEEIGESLEKMKIHLLRITENVESEDEAEDKQVALITALHGGPERSGTTGTLALTEWLLGDSPEAAEIRRKQVLLVMPIPNPYAYFVTDRFGNSLKIDPYTGGSTAGWDFETMTFKSPERSPEVAAFLSVVDRFQPEVHLDLHGTGLQEYPEANLGARERYRGQTMTEITGSAYSNFSLRPWDWRITEAMIAAGNKAGFPSDRFEADAQQLLTGPGIENSGQFWRGRAQFYSALYGYARYHTMIGALEIGWEESGVARARGLLEIGNEIWDSEFESGYPVDRVKGFIGHYLTSTGSTAKARRKSRVELWQKQARMSQGVLYPQTAGRDTFFLGLTEAGVELLDGELETVLDRLDAHPEFDGDAVRAFMESGPEIKLAMEKGNGRGALQDGRIENGFGVRLRVPYRKAEIIDVRVNGHEVDDYRTKIGGGFLQVQIDVSPEFARKMDAAVVTCAYIPNEQREYGWEPPIEVLERLKNENR
ncbi:MAG: hypothetical protein ACI8UO_004667 [Verrucomicrobiales bacterium]|jgi:hypothetical protein